MGNPVSEEKQALRVRMRAMEKALPSAYRQSSQERITARLLALTAWQIADTVFCFVGTAREIDTRPILTAALSAGKQLCVPLCRPVGIMEARQVNDIAELSPGAYGILEPPENSRLVPPDAIDLALIPCITCSHSGQRLGQGGGYYDRFLSANPGNAIILCRERLIRAEIPVGSLDVPIPWVLTEAGFFEDGVPARE